jgi:DNA-binding GntR family transcriptional regulator
MARKRKLATSPRSNTELYEALLSKIMSGEYVAGQRLVESEIAEAFQTSRTPVREVLVALAKDGVVERIRNCGARVKTFSPDDVEEIYDVRAVLECFAVRRAARSLPLNKLHDLERRFEALYTAEARPGWAKKQVDMDRELHRLILSHSGNRRVAVQLDNIAMLINALRSIGYRKVDHMREAVREHLGIVGALLRRDAAEAERLMFEHIETSKRFALERFFDHRSPRPSASESALRPI